MVAIPHKSQLIKREAIIAGAMAERYANSGRIFLTTMSVAINNKMRKLKFIDLFAGLGGIRLGFENAFNNLGFQTECVMTSEIKPYAVSALKSNWTSYEQIRCQLLATD